MARKPVHPVNMRRAAVKTAFILAIVISVLAGLIHAVSGQVIDELKHSLSMWTVIALVVIINLVSFACFMVLYMAYQWVRCDLKGPRDKDFES